MNTARALRAARRRAGLSQRRLAERAGIPQPAVARIEKGRTIPRVDTLDRLLEACGERLESIPRRNSGVDLTQIRERLSWTPRQRLEELVSAAEALSKIRGRAT